DNAGVRIVGNCSVGGSGDVVFNACHGGTGGGARSDGVRIDQGMLNSFGFSGTCTITDCQSGASATGDCAGFYVDTTFVVGAVQGTSIQGLSSSGASRGFHYAGINLTTATGDFSLEASATGGTTDCIGIDLNATGGAPDMGVTGSLTLTGTAGSSSASG